MLVLLLRLISFVFLARAILSWFPIGYDSPVAPVRDVIFRATEPVLAPIRQMMPRTGAFDFSIIIVLLVISFILIPIAASL